MLRQVRTNGEEISRRSTSTYTPDGMGNRINMTDLAGQHVYTYDDTYQLTNATHPNMSLEQFTYDGVGNRLTSAESPPSPSSTEYVYDFDNRLIEVNYTGTLLRYRTPLKA